MHLFIGNLDVFHRKFEFYPFGGTEALEMTYGHPALSFFTPFLVLIYPHRLPIVSDRNDCIVCNPYNNFYNDICMSLVAHSPEYELPMDILFQKLVN